MLILKPGLFVILPLADGLVFSDKSKKSFTVEFPIVLKLNFALHLGPLKDKVLSSNHKGID